jgi:transcriptional regulator with XRE-family HTH domain
MRNINKYEKNIAIPSALILKKIAEAFGVSADYLLFGDTDDLVVSKIGDKSLLKYFEEIEKLDDEDKEFVKKFLQMIKTKNDMKQLTADI